MASTMSNIFLLVRGEVLSCILEIRLMVPSLPFSQLDIIEHVKEGVLPIVYRRGLGMYLMINTKDLRIYPAMGKANVRIWGEYSQWYLCDQKISEIFISELAW